METLTNTQVGVKHYLVEHNKVLLNAAGNKEAAPMVLSPLITLTHST